MTSRTQPRGDRLIVRGHLQGEPPRDAEVIEILGEDGGPPFRARWSDDGHVSLLFPGSDASVEHLEHGSRNPKGRSRRPPDEWSPPEIRR